MDLNKSAARNIEWHIENISKKSAIDGKRVISSNFSIIFDEKVTKWYLYVKIGGSNLGIFLHQSEPILTGFITKWEVYIRTSSNGIEEKHQWEKDFSTIEPGTGWGRPSFISIAKILEHPDQYLQNDTLTIVAKIELVKIKEDEPKPSTSDSTYHAVFEDYFESKSFSDITFVCSDGTEIPAHRFVLAAFSPVLKKILDIETSYTIKVDDIDGPAMTEILRYIYTKNVKDIIKYAPKLLHGADKYGLNGLKELCAKAMMKNLSLGNAIDYFLLADKYDIKDLLDHCIQFIKAKQSFLIKKSESWNQLDKKHLNMLLENYQANPEYILVLESTF